MSKLSSKKPSPATVISMLALFVALSGVAIASVPNNSVTSAKVRNNALKSIDIKNGQVRTADVANNNLTGNDIVESTLIGAIPGGPAGGDLTGTYPNPLIGSNAVSSGDVANESLAAADLAAGSVGTSEVALNSLTASDLAADSVTSSEIAAGAVGASEIGDKFHEHTSTGNAADATALNGDWTSTAAITATCAAGEELVAGQAQWTTAGDENAIREIDPNYTAESVTAQGITDNGTTETLQVIAVCSS